MPERTLFACAAVLAQGTHMYCQVPECLMVPSLLQVLVTHGGVEMGQGLHIKMAQVAAHELGVPVSKVFIAETSTDKVWMDP